MVYACYINDTDLILERVEKAGNAELNKKFQYVGTPLGLCAENNNLTAFFECTWSDSTGKSRKIRKERGG